MTAETLPDAIDRSRVAPRTRFSGLVFAVKAAALRVRRAAGDIAAGPPRLARVEAIGFPTELAVLAAGTPVFASHACGLDPQPGLTPIPPDDPDALATAIASANLGR